MGGGVCVPAGMWWSYFCSLWGLGNAAGDEYIIAAGSLISCGLALWANWRFFASKKGQIAGAAGWFSLPLGV